MEVAGTSSLLHGRDTGEAAQLTVAWSFDDLDELSSTAVRAGAAGAAAPASVSANAAGGGRRQAHCRSWLSRRSCSLGQLPLPVLRGGEHR
jgi:hypothetical protein